MVTARDSEYDEKIYRIVAPEGTPLWLRVTKDAEARAEVPAFVEARMPPPGPVWQEIPLEYFGDDPEFYERAHGHYGAKIIEQLTAAPNPEFPESKFERLGFAESKPVEDMLKRYETAASFIVGRPARYGSFTGTMLFDRNATPRAYKLVTIVYQGSTVWLTDIDKGPVSICTLWDLIAVGAHGIEPKTKYGPSVEFERVGYLMVGKKRKKKLWLLSEEQWNTATYPPESQGGPPYVRGVSVARDGRMAKR